MYNTGKEIASSLTRIALLLSEIIFIFIKEKKKAFSSQFLSTSDVHKTLSFSSDVAEWLPHTSGSALLQKEKGV